MTKGLSRFIVFYCGLLMSIGAFSIDITLPAVPAMVAALDAPYGVVQWTITIYMFSSAFGQLFWGPASDKYGRKPMLGAGLAIYLVGSMVAIFAPNIELILFGRALQGFGAASAMVASRAIIRDLYNGDQLSRNLAFATMVFALGPIVAPLAGALIADLGSWRHIFIALAVWSMIQLLMLVPVPETNKALVANALSFATYLRRAKRVIGHPQSRRFLIVSFVVMSAMLLIIAAVPRIYEENFGLVGLSFAFFFAAHGIGIVIGQWVNRRMIRSFGTVVAALVGNVVLIVASAGMLAMWVLGLSDPFVLTGLLILFATSYLVVYSNAAALVLDPHGDIAGFTAALYGFTSQIGSAIVVSMLVFFVEGSIPLWAAALTAICVINLVLIATWQRSHPVAARSPTVS